MPSPAFPLAKTINENIAVETRNYNLLPDQEFEIDLEHAETLVDDKTKIMLVNNPSNPCGSLFSREHMEAITAFATKHHLILVSDEVYYGLAYHPEKEFISFPEVAKDIPVITTGALSKIYAVPGWRLGWCIVYNRHNLLDEIKQAMSNLSMIWLHPTSLI